MFLRRSAHSRFTITAVVAFALVLAFAAPAFGASAKSVHIRIEGANGTLFNADKTVGATTFTDSTGVSYSTTSAPTPLSALALASRLSGFPFEVKDFYGTLMVLSANGELPGPEPDFDGWMFRINGSETRPGDSSDYYTADGVRLRAGDNVLWYYGAWDASPLSVSPATSRLTVGETLVVTAKQLDVNGVATPVAGAAVHVGSVTATSTANGTVSIPMNAVGDFGVRAEKAHSIRSAIKIVHVRKASAFSGLKFSANKVEVGAVPVFSGTLLSGSTKLAGRTVRIWHRAKNSTTWVAGSTKVTSSTGTVRFSVKPKRSTYYRLTYGGSSTYAPVTSASKLLTIR